jgi:hypothetical protein
MHLSFVHSCSAQLKETDQPVKFKKELYATLRREYAIRYLEAIGATPTPQMIRMVQKQQPLKKDMVSAAWKSRGGLDDRLYIAPHFHKPPEQEALMKQVGGKGKVNGMAKNTKGKGGSGGGGGADASVVEFLDPLAMQRRATIGGVMQGVGGVPIVTEYEVPPVDPGTSEFELLKRKYVYPFNTPANPKFNNHSEANDVDEAAAQARRIEEAGDGDTVGSEGGGLDAHSFNQDPQRSDADQLGHEIATPLEVSVKQIELIQKRFLNTFPFNRLQHKMQNGELDTLNHLIVSANMKRLVGLTAHYLYFTSFQKFSGARGDALPEKRRRETYTAIVECFSQVELSVRRARGDRMLVMALILLSLRVAIENIFRNHFPTWFTFESFVQANFWSGNRTTQTAEIRNDATARVDAKRGLTGAAKRRLDEAKRRSRADSMAFSDSDGGASSSSPFKVMAAVPQSAMDPRRIEVILETLHVGPLGATLTVMNSVLTDIFDAKRYYGRISALESTGEGIRILSQANLLRSRTAARPVVSEDLPGADLGKDPAARMAEDVAAERTRKRRNREKRRKHQQHQQQQQQSSMVGGGAGNSNADRSSSGRRSTSPPTSPDMMAGGKFHLHVQEMDELRKKQVGSRSSSETMAAGYATSGLVKSVFSSPSAPRARQILYRGGKSVAGRPTTSERAQQQARRKIGAPSPPARKQVSWRNQTRRPPRRRPTTTASKGTDAAATRGERRRQTRPSSRPTLTAAGKTALHRIAVGKVRERYSRGVQNGVATSRMRVLDDLVG